MVVGFLAIAVAPARAEIGHAPYTSSGNLAAPTSGVGQCPSGQVVTGTNQDTGPTCKPGSTVAPAYCGADVVLVSGAGSFSNSCVTATSYCQCRDRTNNNYTCYTTEPLAGVVGVVGNATDTVQTTCTSTTTVAVPTTPACIGSVLLATGTGLGTFTSSCVAANSYCSCRDTTDNSAACYTGNPSSGSVSVTGNDGDLAQVSCTQTSAVSPGVANYTGPINMTGTSAPGVDVINNVKLNGTASLTGLTANGSVSVTGASGNATDQIGGVNLVTGLDPQSANAAMSKNTSAGTFTPGASTTAVVLSGTNDWLPGQGAYAPFASTTPCSVSSTACSSTGSPTPTVLAAYCDDFQVPATPFQIAAASLSHTWSADAGVYLIGEVDNAPAMEPLVLNGSGLGTYSVSAGTYTFNAGDVSKWMRICYGTSAPTAGSNFYTVAVVGRDANGGYAAASTSATISSVNIALPATTSGLLIRFTEPSPAYPKYTLCLQVGGGSWFQLPAVWSGEMLWGTAAGPGVLYMGSGNATTEDSVCNGVAPPSTQGNDNLFTTVSASSGSTVTLNAVSQAGTFTLYHDDTAALTTLENKCAAYTAGQRGCQINIGGAQTLRVKSNTIVSGLVNQFVIQGQGSNTSEVQFFGDGGGLCPSAGVTTTGQFVDNSGTRLTLRNLHLTSTNSDADCMIDVSGGGAFTGFYTQDVIIDGNGSGYGGRHGIVFVNGSGHLDAGSHNFDNFLQAAGINNFVMGTNTASHSWNTQWPGAYFDAGIEYGHGTNFTVGAAANSDWLITAGQNWENFWHVMRPINAQINTNLGAFSGFGIAGPPFNGDLGTYVLSNGTSGTTPQSTGTLYDLVGVSAARFQVNAGGSSNAVNAGMGAFWLHGTSQNSRISISNSKTVTSAFAVIAELPIELINDTFGNITTNNTVVSINGANGRSLINGDYLLAQAAATGVTGLAIGFTNAQPGAACAGSGTYDFAYQTGMITANTILNQCVSTNIVANVYANSVITNGGPMSNGTATQATLPAGMPVGTQIYCSNCKNSIDDAATVGAACAAAGHGALAVFQSSLTPVWSCK